MPFIKFQTSPKSSGNSGSVSPAIAYFAKEDKDRDPDEIGHGFFSSEKTGINPDEAKGIIEHSLYSKSLGKDESKYFHVLIGFSAQELEGKTDKELIEFVQKNFAETYLEAGNRHEIDPSQLAWCAKLENVRKYKGDDIKVQENAKKSGQLKDGDNRHIHIVVARKTLDNRKISPLSNHFRTGKSSGAVAKGFDQTDFKVRIEHAFDQEMKHSRKKEDSVSTLLAAYRPDLFKPMNHDKIILESIEKNIHKLSKLLSPKVKKVRAFISKASEAFMKDFIDKIKRRYLRTDKKYEALRPHLAEHTIGNNSNLPLQPVSNTPDKPFNFLEELYKLQEKIKTAPLEEHAGLYQEMKDISERKKEEEKLTRDNNRKNEQNKGFIR